MFSICKKGSLSGWKGKKGQFTIFVIIGLVIFFAFAFALYARVQIMSAQLGRQADVQLQDYLNKNSINQYVTSCLDAVADDVFIRASMQGGTFNFTNMTQYINYTEHNDVAYNKTFNISIVVDSNTGCPDGRPLSAYYIVTQDPGYYPLSCRYEYTQNLQSAYNRLINPCRNDCNYKNFRSYSGFFGVNYLPILCNPLGANRYGNEYGIASCEYYDDFDVSMQSLLEQEIAQDINKCVNFTEVLRTVPSNISKIGDVNVTVIFKKSGTIVKLEYPFTIIMHNRQPVTRIADFSIERNLPFKELYEYSYELANNDVKNVTFNIFEDMENVVGGKSNLLKRDQNVYRENFIVKVIYGNNTNNFINIIQVIDTAHKIRGLNFTMAFAVANRRPLLEYIHESHPLYDMAVVEGQIIYLVPEGYDPDDELMLKYYYSEWLENYNDYYNWSDLKCVEPDSLDYVITNCTYQNTSVLSIPENSWSNSSDYILSKKNATYNATRDDIGLHTVRISVVDRAGLDDYQDVRILVFDLPEAKINGSNMFEDVADNRASYEDIYILNGSESTVGAIASTIPNMSFLSFRWNDSTEPFAVDKIIQTPADKAITIPFDTQNPPLTTNEVNIMNIKDYIFKSTVYDSVMHEVYLKVTNTLELSGENKFLVNVTECVNHISETDVPSYPFDTLPQYGVQLNDLAGHLQANHTCCNDDMTYASMGTICFLDITYGGYMSFKDYGLLPNTEDYTIEYTPLLNDDTENDIFRQDFQAFCSEDRGNTCTGDIIETREVINPCQDDNGISSGTFQDEKCSGPHPDFFVANSSTTTDTDATCYDYTAGQSFEDLLETSMNVGIDDYDGTCTTQKRCSNGWIFEEYDASITAKYSCMGQCDGTGQCNSADQNSCTCESTCDSAANPACDGVTYDNPFNPGYGAPNQPSCDGVGQTYLADRCDDCGLMDILGRCKSSTVAGDGCTADAECEGSTPSMTLTRCISGTSYTARCDTTCHFVQASPAITNFCRTLGTGCTGNFSCNDQRRNFIRSTTASNSNYCDQQCNIVACGRGHTFDVASQTCNNYCTSSSDCISGYTCCFGTGCPASINVGQCYSGGGPVVPPV